MNKKQQLTKNTSPQTIVTAPSIFKCENEIEEDPEDPYIQCFRKDLPPEHVYNKLLKLNHNTVEVYFVQPILCIHCKTIQSGVFYA